MSTAGLTTSTRTVHSTRHIVIHIAGQIGMYLTVASLSFAFMVPFLWTLSSAFKGPWELFVFPPRMLPEGLRWQNFVEVFTRVPYLKWAANSAYVAALCVIGQVLSASLVAYGFSRFEFPGKNVLFLIVLSMMMLPIQVTIIPLFLIYRQVGLLDTHVPLWLPRFFGGGAFFIFMLRQFFLTIPRDFDESAELDGASDLTILTRIILPLSKPALVSVVIFTFLQSWNAFLPPLFFLNTMEKFTLPLGLRYFQTLPEDSGEPRQHLLMAASTVITVPVVILFFAGQRYFIQGVVMSGIKG